MSFDDDRLSIASTAYRNVNDDTTILDSSTVPTYEEFKCKKKLEKNRFFKLRYLNSTQNYEPSSILTDDDSDENEENNYKNKQSPVKVANNVIEKNKLCQEFEKLGIKKEIKSPQSIEDSEYYISVESKQIQTSFNDIKMNHDETTAINDTVESIDNSENKSLDIISETIIESPKQEKNQMKLLLKTPIRITESFMSTSINQTKSPMVFSNRVNASNNIITTYEKHKIGENKNVLIINHQLEKNIENKNKKKQRVSMCAEDLPLNMIENNLDEDENRLDVTRGNIVLIDSVVENDKENNGVKSGLINEKIMEESSEDEEKVEKEFRLRLSSDSVLAQKATKHKTETKNKNFKLRLSSDSESNEEAFEKFLENYRKPQKQATNNQNNDRKNLKKYFVDDDYSSTTSSESDQEEISSSSSSDEQVFYIKTTQKLNKNKIETKSIFKKPNSNKNRQATTKRSSSSSSTSSDEHEVDADADTSTSIIHETPTKNRGIVRKKSDTALEIEFKTPIQTKNPYGASHCRTELKKMPIVKKFNFIESLSSNLIDEQRHPDANDFIKKFSNKKVKDELLRTVFHIFNDAIFEGKLPRDMKLVWNNRLTSTAGMCKYKSDNGKPVAEIHISSKVCDTPDRLRDTCVHEMCHSAVYLIHGSKTEGHGRLWQYWALRVSEVFKNIPKVSTSHNYTINKKFTYRCVDCKQEIHRFQKSIDIDKNACGRCHGRFILVNNNIKQKKSQADNDPKNTDQALEDLVATPRRLNTFAQFVKDNYSSIKIEKNLNSHKDIMQEISKKFKLLTTK